MITQYAVIETTSPLPGSSNQFPTESREMKRLPTRQKADSHVKLLKSFSPSKYCVAEYRVEEFSFMPKVDDLATICYVTDQHPAVVTKVSPSGKTIEVTRIAWRVVEGSELDGSAEYEYDPTDLQGEPEVYTYRESFGKYVRKGGSAKYGTRALLGSARRYYDPHF